MGVKWVDANKGDTEKPEYRCRLVAKDVKTDKRGDFVCGDPAAEGEEGVFAFFASMLEMCWDSVNVVKAYLRPGRITSRVCAASSRRRCTARGMQPILWS